MRRILATALLVWVAALSSTGCRLPDVARADADGPVRYPSSQEAEDRSVLLGLALRQEMPSHPAETISRRPFCHIDLVVGNRIVGFYNTHERRGGLDRLTFSYRGEFRDYDWLAENRRYYVDGVAARCGPVLRGVNRPVVTTWIATRVDPDTARRIEAAAGRRIGVSTPYHLIGRNCASRIADILKEAEWLPATVDPDVFPAIDLPVRLARLFADRAGKECTTMARGWFTFRPDGAVLVEPLP